MNKLINKKVEKIKSEALPHQAMCRGNLSASESIYLIPVQMVYYFININYYYYDGANMLGLELMGSLKMSDDDDDYPDVCNLWIVSK